MIGMPKPLDVKKDSLGERPSLAVCRLRARAGFSLIELTVVILIMATLAMGMGMILNPVMYLWRIQTFQQGPVLEGRLALMRMSREMSAVRNRTSVATADSNTFSFTDANNQNITFNLNGTTLERNNVTLAERVTTLQFIYLDANGQAIATPAVSPAETDIRRISIDLQITGAGQPGQTVTLRSQMKPRNLSI